MVITNETKSEIKNFHELFSNYVDDITITPYQERGGGLNDIDKKIRDKLRVYFSKNNLDLETPYLSTGDGKLYISEGRKACYQPLQRLMITYNGMVAMCCMDWGAQHCVGYLDELGFKNDLELDNVYKNIKNNKKGFQLLKKAKYPLKYNLPEKKISTLKEIWYGNEINFIRNIHKEIKLNTLDVCKNCSFVDTYKWKLI